MPDKNISSRFVSLPGLPAMTRLAAALMLAAALAACSRSGNQPPAQAQSEVGYVVVKVQRQALTTELPGRTTAYLTADIRPQVGGIIQKRLFKEGATVRQGQPLYQIDAASYQAAYDSAKASLLKAEATLASSRLKAQRYAELDKIDAVAKQDNDDAQSTLRQNQADVEVQKAAVKTAAINLEYTRILSPISGRIEKSSVTPGALVTASQTTALTTVQQIDPIYVDVTQSTVELLRLRRELASGQIKKSGENSAPVKIVLEDGSTYERPGKLEFSGLSVDTGTGMITLRAVVPNPDGILLPGAYVRAVLEEGVDEQAMLVPQKAVSRDQTGAATALVIGEGGKVEQRLLTVARAVGNNWWVTKGIKPGDKVIVDGLQKVRSGDVPRAIDITDTLQKDLAREAAAAAADPSLGGDAGGAK
ncbi:MULTISPECIES: efflux RND transporter periplasmic adaptor subunit [unclassified Herbaspirillum]|uniref:efflux RND transporter periplasmic adaptor subunit n=1 Tax=unclassified Herbaspirillum TaxID=2624150 RepID=UPI00116924DC|nr:MULTISPECIES: efflux RND transporter periplasmic adaptor subunit [unclassified Herbaspirillum]MBB5389978.1 membrane fusion protein (multidrug efflux system) [Herbaspirillum sp. SJZ102]TQK09514.1 membrane fusion protein (multidrug efflux system) [Herbaspirillum sp. SJZ130]TQK13799.1 membrane fusion protein (multidrug efflux system) [Herbaspirillum sp. SJZ106]